MTSEVTVVLIEVAALAAFALLFGWVLGSWTAKRRSRAEAAAYTEELRRTQRRLRSAERTTWRPARAGYGAASGQRSRGS